MEIYFKPLDNKCINDITRNAASKVGLQLEEEALMEISRHASNGREAVNMVQLVAGMAQVEKSTVISQRIVQKVINNGHRSARVWN